MTKAAQRNQRCVPHPPSGASNGFSRDIPERLSVSVLHDKLAILPQSGIRVRGNGILGDRLKVGGKPLRGDRGYHRQPSIAWPAMPWKVSLKILPRFAIHNQLNAWGRHRDIPPPGKETFHDWYKKHRIQATGQEKNP
jgi:hypothetical protein